MNQKVILTPKLMRVFTAENISACEKLLRIHDWIAHQDSEELFAEKRRDGGWTALDAFVRTVVVGGVLNHYARNVKEAVSREAKVELTGRLWEMGLIGEDFTAMKGLDVIAGAKGDLDGCGEAFLKRLPQMSLATLRENALGLLTAWRECREEERLASLGGELAGALDAGR